jgi:hypothetical protein
MNQNNVSPSQPLNQRRLKEITNLPSYVIRHLKKTNQLKFKRVGTEDIFDENSVNRFMESFNIEDYLTIGECRKVLVEREYYTERMSNIRFYRFPLDFYITVKTLIVGNSDIPKEYRLITKKFDKTQYVSKESFNRTLEWLDGIHRKLNPPQPTFTPISPPKQTKPKQRGLNGTTRIRLKKKPTFRSSVIPSMVCPLSPLNPII